MKTKYKELCKGILLTLFMVLVFCFLPFKTVVAQCKVDCVEKRAKLQKHVDCLVKREKYFASKFNNRCTDPFFSIYRRELYFSPECKDRRVEMYANAPQCERRKRDFEREF